MFLDSREGGISNFHLAGLRAVQVLLSIYVWRILGGGGQGGHIRKCPRSLLFSQELPLLDEAR